MFTPNFVELNMKYYLPLNQLHVDFSVIRQKNKNLFKMA